MLDPRAIALQGVGYSPLLVAVQGFGSAVVSDWVTDNARAYGKAKRQGIGREYNDALEMRHSIELLRQIEAEDEIVLAVVMAAAPLLGVRGKWQRH